MFTLFPGQLTLEQLRDFSISHQSIELTNESISSVVSAAELITQIMKNGRPVYGINTGFGSLANTKIDPSDMEQLQYNLIVSHAVGVGRPLPDEVVRLIMLLKINSLAQGYSGVTIQTLNMLVTLFNAEVYPVIPAKGSVGASGDLAPLAHLSLCLLGKGKVRWHGHIVDASEVLNKLNLAPAKLAPKEGLALLNGTQVSTAIALSSVFQIENCFNAAIIAGALSVDAMRASTSPFHDKIQLVRGQPGQKVVAQRLRSLLENSEINQSHADCEKVQDPYSFRCQPQVMGACLDNLQHICERLIIEANGVTDNPLVLDDEQLIVSGGNFHAEPVAFAADYAAITCCEIGAISERRSALLIDNKMSDLPPFLVEQSGLNSGFMIAQVTAAALVSENKMLAHPASIDSIPTSANQEDHVSMATHGAYRLTSMAENLANVIAIELLCASQAMSFHQPKQTSPALQANLLAIRKVQPVIEVDQSLADSINTLAKAVLNGEFETIVNKSGF